MSDCGVSATPQRERGEGEGVVDLFNCPTTTDEVGVTAETEFY